MKRKLLLLLALGLTLSVSALGQGVEKKVEVVAEHSAPLWLAQAEDTANQSQQSTDQQPLVWVFRHRRVKQCVGTDMSLDESRAKLTDLGVAVHESHCGYRTDKVFVSGCGEPTGQILLHLIRANALDDAIEAGYGPAEQIKYQKVDCPKEAENP